MNALSILAKVNDGFFRAAALRAERARVPAAGSARERATGQARLYLEVARQVEEPLEPLPPGSRPLVVLALAGEGIRWALIAADDTDAEVETPPDLKTLWQKVHPQQLLAAPPDAPTMEMIERGLFRDLAASSLQVTEGESRPVREFGESLVAALDAPRLRLSRLRGQRWLRIAITAAAVMLGSYALWAVTRGPNLAEGRPVRTSSTWAGCAGDPNCSGLLFCTDTSDTNPWAEIDLGAPTTFHRVEVTNRGDCCSERAVPLIVEVSSDRASWTQVARRDADFSHWTAKLKPVTARFVRFRVPRQTVFHLQEVAIR
jgi:F5/8 type C domain-containing protein